MSDYSPVNIADASPFTLTAGAVLAGGQLVELSANDTVIPAVGVNRAIGVAANDTPSGGRVTVWPLTGILHETPVTGVIVLAAGAPVKAATSGAAGSIDTGALGALAAGGLLLGICVRGNTGPAKARWLGL